MLLKVTDAMGGKKYALAIFLVLLFTLFGIYVVEKEADLGDAALFIAAIGGTAGIYWAQNVRQKINGSG